MSRKWIAALALVGAAVVSVGTAGPANAATGTHLSSSPAAGGGHGIGDDLSLGSVPDCGGGGSTGDN